MAKVTFVYPDFESLGVEYLMAVCLQDGHEVDFVHYHAEDPYLGSKAKHIPFHDIARTIADTRPHVAAFSCVTDNYQYQLQCAGVLKELMPHIITVFGGVHPTAVPEKLLKRPEVDCIAIGEAEKAFADFLREGGRNSAFDLPDGEIKGLIFKKEGSLVGEFREGPLPDLNTLPFPYKDPFFSSLRDSSHEYRILTSRGCPYSCSYCFNPYLHKLRRSRLVRQRSPANVNDELAWAKERHPLKHVIFVDDSFITNPEWIFEFCERYRREIGLPFSCFGTPASVNQRVAEALSSAGCVNMQVGTQSLSEELCREILHRKSDNAQIARAIQHLKRAGIMVQVDHMLGIPGDTLELQEESVRFFNKYRPSLVSVFWLTYYPKTPIVEIARSKGIVDEDDINNIEEGTRLTDESYLTGGSMRDAEPYYGISLLLNYLPILPRWLINLLVRTRLYRVLRIKNYFISTALPRVVQSVFNRKDFRGRSHMIRFMDKIFLRRLNRPK